MIGLLEKSEEILGFFKYFFRKISVERNTFYGIIEIFIGGISKEMTGAIRRRFSESYPWRKFEDIYGKVSMEVFF